MTQPASRPERRPERPSAIDRLTSLVRDDLSSRQIPPTDTEAVRISAMRTVEGFQRVAAAGHDIPLDDPARTVERIVGRVTGLGPFEKLFAPRTAIEDIFIEGGAVRYFEGGQVRYLVEPVSETEALRVVRQLLAGTDIALDRGHPVVDGVQVLEGRARLAATVHPVSPHLSAAIRLYAQRNASLRALVDGDSISKAAAALLTLDVRAKGSILIAGETGSGKSTLLASLLGQARPNHNVRLVEESGELQFQPQFGGRQECVADSVDGEPSGAASLRDLIKLSLRFKPDIIAVGEVRDEASWELARASRVGAGFLTTIHANSAADALEALVLTALGAGANIQERLVRRTFSQSLHFVAFCERDDANLVEEGGAYRHQVTEIRVLTPIMGDEAFSSEPIFVREGGIGSDMVWTEILPPTPLCRRLERQLGRGVTLHDVLTGRIDPLQ